MPTATSSSTSGVTRRTCTRNACSGTAIATLTYSYADSQAVLGPLAASHEPGAYDLCRLHADTLTVPRGWEVVRLPLEATPITPSPDALVALADAVREVGLRHDEVDLAATPNQTPPPGVALLDERRRRRDDQA